jgi:hypothetical protein
MFLGHFALGFAAKPLTPSTSLGTLMIGALLADLAWPVLVLAGVEIVEVAPGATAVTPLDFVHYPYSHSLLALLGWALAFGAGYALLRRSGKSPALILGGLVLSHWLLDVLSHRPDMPLTIAGSTRLGLGLWNSVLGTALVELSMFGAGVWLYVRGTRPLDRKGFLGWVALCAFLMLLYVANLLGPSPPSARAVAVVGLSTWLLIAWAYFIDRHREPRAER